MLDTDLTGVILAGLDRGNRAPDGMLHPSGDLIGSLRHTQLRMAGAPQKSDSFASQMRLLTGTLIHSWLGDQLEVVGTPVMREVKTDRGLPEGWSGTADYLVWSELHNAFVLVDLKTTKGEGIQYIERDGAKEEHVWQVSAYWHAFVAMGYPMYSEVGVYYLPVSEDFKAENPVEPVMAWVTPLDEVLVRTQMEDRREHVTAYLTSLRLYPDGNPRPDGSGLDDPAYWLTEQLADPMPRTQKLFKQGDSYNVTLVPHWTAMFCPYDTALCDCGHELEGTKTTKIGTWQHNSWGWEYIPRSGYEDVQPDVKPQGRIAA